MDRRALGPERVPAPQVERREEDPEHLRVRGSSRRHSLRGTGHSFRGLGSDHLDENYQL